MAELIFGIHCHQPVGNFDFVIEKAFEQAYIPFLKEVLPVKDFKFSLHVSGFLFEWAKEKKSEFFELVGELVSENRLELQVGGFYEPILAVIPSYDRVDQILLHIEFIEKEFGYKPEGLWLTERIWDPSIVKDLVSCGIRYVLVDDYHFLCAGFSEKDIKGFFITEVEGEKLYVFPINEKLRYYIPFKPVPELLSFLNQTEGLYTIYDDGEKFGIWPGTYEWVYKKGWLKTFLEKVASGDVKILSFAQVLENFKPTSRAYLPITSYFEMGEWSLNTELAFSFKNIVEHLKREGRFTEYRPFLRGGIWHNFLVKYPEANRMHKRMLWVSKALSNRDRNSQFRKALFKAQCNDAYWHGIFGGIYLPHLRRAVYQNLIEAEKGLEFEKKVIVRDLDCDGYDELFFFGKNYDCWIYPSQGAQLKEFSIKEPPYNLFDVLTRRLEHYHFGERVEEKSKKEGVFSIHEIARALKEKPEYDDFERGSFIDRVFIEKQSYSLWNWEYFLEKTTDEEAIFLCYFKGIDIRKTFVFEDKRLVVKYKITSPYPIFFETEININPGTPEAFMETPERKGLKVTGRFFFISDVLAIALPLIGKEFRIGVNNPCQIFTLPIYTVSQSEKGFEKIYQGSALIFKSIKEREEHEFSFTLEVLDA